MSVEVGIYLFQSQKWKHRSNVWNLFKIINTDTGPSLLTHSSDLPPALKSKFWLPPPEGGIWKIKKRGWKYGAGAGPLKRGEADTFPIYFFQGLSFLHLEITLLFAKFCYVFEENLFFLLPWFYGKYEKRSF